MDASVKPDSDSATIAPDVATPGAPKRKSRRNAILRSFTELVAENGYDEVSLRDVAESLGMSKGTIVHHFGSKDRMLEAVHSEYMDIRLAEAKELLASISNPADQLRAIIFQLLLAEQSDRAATVAFAREIVRFASNPVMIDVREKRREYSQIVKDIITRGIEDGTFVPVDPEMVSLQVFGMCNWSWTWFDPKGRITAEAVAEHFSQTLLGGLLAERPVTDSTEIARLVRRTMAR